MLNLFHQHRLTSTLISSFQRDLTPPYVDDGLLEIVGFRNGWHGLVLLAPKGHGTRLAQVPMHIFDYWQFTSLVLLQVVPHTFLF